MQAKYKTAVVEWICAFMLTLTSLVPSAFALSDNFENHPGGDLSIAGDTNSMQWTTTRFNDRAECRAEIVQYNKPSQNWAFIKAGMPSPNVADPGCTAKIKNSNVFEPFTNSVSFNSYISVYGDGGGLPEFQGHATIEVKFYDTDGILQNTLTRTCYSNPFRAARPCTSAPDIKKYEYKIINGILYEIVDGTPSSLGAFGGTGYIGYVEFQADIKRTGYAGWAEAYMYIKDFNTSVEQTIPQSTAPIPTAQSQNSMTNASVSLYSEKTDVVLGEDILLKLSAVNLITKPKMHVQVIIIPPSGMSVTSSEFSKSGAGQFTTSYELEPGDGKDIEVSIRSNQVGDFNANGRIIYYFGDEKDKGEDYALNLPIKVRKEPGQTAPAGSNDVGATPKAPGFAGGIAIIGVLFVALLIKKRI